LDAALNTGNYTCSEAHVNTLDSGPGSIIFYCMNYVKINIKTT